MTALARHARRTWRAAGSLAGELPWFGFADSRTVLTLDGEVLSMALLAPRAAAGRSVPELAADVEDWVRILGQVPLGCRLSLHAMRRPCPVPPDRGEREFPASAWARREREVASRCGDLRVVATWCLDAGLAADGGLGRRRPSLRGLRGLAGKLLGGGEAERAEVSVEAACGRLRSVVDGQLALVGDGARLLAPAEMCEVLADLANRPGTPAPGPGRGGDLSRRLALSDIEAHRRRLEIGGESVALLALSEPPPAAGPNALRELAAGLDGAWTWHWEWRRLSTAQARSRIKTARAHYFSRRFSMLAHAQDTQGTTLAMEDLAASSEADRMGAASEELEADGMPYGEVAAGLAIHGTAAGVERRAAEAAALVAGADAKCIRETMGQLPAWFARLPGAPRSLQFRGMLASAGAAACLAPLWGERHGHDSCRHLRADPLAVLETPARTRFRWDLFGGGDVAHTLVLGATGSGKSFLLNFLLVNALRYRPRICVLDLGGGYAPLAGLLRGGYLSLDPSAGAGGVSLRPLDLPDTDRSLHFLCAWIAQLLAHGGYECSGDDVGEIRQRVKNTFRLDPDRRRLGALAQVLPPRMHAAMARWVRGGAWGHIFDADGAAPVVMHPDFQVVDISGAERHPDLCAAALSWFLWRMRSDIEDPAELERFKLMVVDEAWRFLGDDVGGAYLAEAAKTWRKRNAALVMASQSAGDILTSEAAPRILESMPNRVFLSSPDLPSAAAEALQLSEAEIAAVRRLQPKGELYLQTRSAAADAGGIVLRLQVSAMERWLYTSSPAEAAERSRAIERLGSVEAAVEELAGEAGPGTGGGALRRRERAGRLHAA